MYKAGFVCFLNTSEKRIILYKNIYEYFSNNNIINRDQLISFGIKSGMTLNKIKDEIIGCLYAPFLIEPSYLSNQLYMTYNGELKFSDLFIEGKFQHCEFPVILEYKKDAVVFKRYLTDSLESNAIDILLQNKWSCNKSLKRLMAKTKTQKDYLSNIRLILTLMETFNYNNCSYLDLVNKYGRTWANGKDKSCNLHSRSFFKSDLIDIYEGFFSELLEVYKKPIDWNGIPINIKDFEQLMKIYNVNLKTDEFIEKCIRDCLIRYVNKDYLTFTSTGYFLITSFINENLNRLNIIIRKYAGNNFELNIAINSKLKLIDSFLNKNQFKYNDRGWFVKSCNLNELVCIFEDIYLIYNPNKLVQYTFTDLE